MQEILGHQFADREVLLLSLTHSSYSNEQASLGVECRDNERLEYLGDAVLGLVVAEALMDIFPHACEGKLSQWRSHLVSRQTLSELAGSLKLGEYLRLGKGERRSGGGRKTSILAAAFEAVVGALYLDGGVEAAAQFIQSSYSNLLSCLKEGNGYVSSMTDCKTYLQECTQEKFRTTPVYRLVDTWGLEHQKMFRVELRVGDEVVSVGEGKSKKSAEQEAAGRALKDLGF